MKATSETITVEPLINQRMWEKSKLKQVGYDESEFS